MKYIIFDSNGLETPIVFPGWLMHEQVVLLMQMPVISAGRIDLTDIEFFNQNIEGLLEVSIGHALISDALYLGIENTIQLYLREVK